ncbi:MAG: class D sortase, partial [Bryobacteraceae bacterium]
QGSADLDGILSQEQVKTTAKARAAITAPPHGGLVGKLEIPRLKLSLIVFEGTDEPVLQRGVGHLAGSAMPGDAGNVVVAAHRDTFFRSLNDIQQGDEILFTTPGGAKRYAVESAEVINPTQTEVLNATSTPTLTLITCYPFYFVGHAPKRFIVRARPIDAADPPKTEVASTATPVTPTPEPVVSAKRPFKLVELPHHEASARDASDESKESDSSDDRVIVNPSKKGRSWNPVRLLGKLTHLGRRSKIDSPPGDLQ